MYAVFLNDSYDVICQTRDVAINVMLQAVKARVRHFKLIGDLTMFSIYEDLEKSHLHMGKIRFRGGVCSLGHEPDLVTYEQFSDIPEIGIYIEKEVKNTP